MNEEELGCTGSCHSCAGCGHDDHEMQDDFSPIITLTDDTGKDTKFEVLDVVVLDDGTEFLVVAEADKMEADDVEVVILQIKEDGGEEVYDTVTDENLAKKVFDEFVKQQDDSEEE
jgi:uncharacterized protein YrzB (UPF0473 family)